MTTKGAPGIITGPHVPPNAAAASRCIQTWPLEAKFNRQEIASISISSSSSSLLALTFLKKGDLEWGRTIPLELLESEEIPLLPPKPSSEGGAEGTAGGGNSGYKPCEVLAVTKIKKIGPYK